MNTMQEYPPDSTGGQIGRPTNATHPHREQRQGIFLHTGWRSAGTWVWSRFRAKESVRAFYEPLSTLLSELSPTTISSTRPTHNAGHPPLQTPYYEEYRTFLQKTGRGVNGYLASFGVDRFGDVPGGDLPALQSYLENLCANSTSQHKVPVLKFCRSQGRTPWLKHAFPGVMHVGVLRNPASQFASGWLLKQEWQNPFFVSAPFRVLGLNRHEPVVRDVIAMCGVKLPPMEAASHEAYAVACDQYARTVEGSDAYRAFVALWVLCLWRMFNAVDLLLDTDRLGQSPEYAAEMRAEFQAFSGVAPEFSTARDLVEETTHKASRISGIDGRLLRTVNFSARKFLLAQLETSSGTQLPIVEIARQKLALADEISERWRY